MKLPINVVLLTPGFAADEQDTTAIPALQLYTRNIKSQFDDVNILIVATRYPAKAGAYDWNGLPVYSAGGANRIFSRLIGWVKVLRHLYHLRKTRGIDIVHSFWLTEASLIGLVFCKLTGIKFLATPMGQDVKPENKYLKILRHFTFKLTIISQFQYEYARHLKKANVLKIIPFGIDRTYFHNFKIKRTIDIIGVGSLNSIKNYIEFVDIIKAIAVVIPGISCKIIGEGINRPQIEKKIKEEELEDNIVLAGNLGYDMTIKEMHRGKILLHTSTFEGQGLVITEALAAGLYVVSHPVGIAARLQTVKLMTGKTGHDLARYILELLTKQELDFKPEIHFTIDDTCTEYHEIYLKLLEEKSFGNDA